MLVRLAENELVRQFAFSRLRIYGDRMNVRDSTECICQWLFVIIFFRLILR